MILGSRVGSGVVAVVVVVCDSCCGSTGGDGSDDDAFVSISFHVCECVCVFIPWCARVLSGHVLTFREDVGIF